MNLNGRQISKGHVTSTTVG